MARCIYCGAKIKGEYDKICATCRWQEEIENLENELFQKRIEERIREKKEKKKKTL